ncbi:MAG: hypothetical protein FWB72_03010 [Firmicutes bacterium]|nr:hypothetical protein [Bacillota bacterium]
MLKTVVSKFGGTSLSSAENILKVADIVKQPLCEKSLSGLSGAVGKSEGVRAFVVVSAPGKRFSDDSKITDLLYKAIEKPKVLAFVKDRFAEIVEKLNNLADGKKLGAVRAGREVGKEAGVEIGREVGAVAYGKISLDVCEYFKGLYDYITKAKIVNTDYVVSRGEYLCAKILAEVLGYNFVDATELILFRNGECLTEESNELASFVLSKLDNAVIPGFYGRDITESTADIEPRVDSKAQVDSKVHKLYVGSKANKSYVDSAYKVTTFARGGSDITGARIARAVGASLYENWSDVDGIYTADPNIINKPSIIKALTYKELRELSFAGATVLHQDSVFPTRKAGIPINIRNTFNTDSAGTLVVPPAKLDKILEPKVKSRKEVALKPSKEVVLADMRGIRDTTQTASVRGLAGKKNYTIIHIEKGKLGLLRDAFFCVFAALKKHNVMPEHMPTGVDSISLVIHSISPQTLEALCGDIIKATSPPHLKIINDIALISIVGKGIASEPRVTNEIFSALKKADVKTRIITQSTADISIIIGVDNKDYERATKALYRALDT